MKSKILGLLTIGMLIGPMSAQAVGVVVGGKEWRQLTETTNFTWNQIATVCDATTGACSGSVGAVSFDSWMWAANTDLQLLFDVLIEPGVTNFPTPTSSFSQMGNADIAAAMAPGAFQPTALTAASELLIGWSRTLVAAGSATAYSPGFLNSFDPLALDSALLNSAAVAGTAGSLRGTWLYRAIPVPEPASATLLIMGLCALAAVRRRSVVTRNIESGVTRRRQVA